MPQSTSRIPAVTQPPKVAHPVVCCPYCHKATVLARSQQQIQQCHQCQRLYANALIEAKPGDSEEEKDELPVKIVGAEVPRWAVHTALALAAIAFVLILTLIAVRVAHRPTYESIIGVMSDVRTVFSVEGKTERFIRNLTFFIPLQPENEFASRWHSFVEALRQDGAQGFTRWKVEGSSDGLQTREGYFVLLAVPVDAESNLTSDAVKAHFHKAFGSREGFFVIEQAVR